MAEAEIVLQGLPRPQGRGTQLKGPLFLFNKTKWHVSGVTHELYIPVTRSRSQYTAFVNPCLWHTGEHLITSIFLE